MRKVKEYYLTGGIITAEEGYRLGMINKVVPKEKLDEEAMAMAEKMLKLLPCVLRANKETINHAYEIQGLKEGIAYGREVFNLVRLNGWDSTPRVKAFWEKTKEAGFDAAMEMLGEKL